MSTRFRMVVTISGIKIRMFMGLPDPGLLVRGMDPAPDPSLFLMKVLSGLKF
jgi:hypothetical protein